MYSVHVVFVPDKDFKANMEDATEVATLTGEFVHQFFDFYPFQSCACGESPHLITLV